MADQSFRKFPRATGASSGDGAPEGGETGRARIALGTGIHDADHRAGSFLVRVLYREPGFEERIGGRDHPYRWTYRIDACCAAMAERLARREFHDTARNSSVGWARDIVGISVRRARDD